ncbi:hypothetical protein EZS27_008882 [termite gut metagenome]|uniref:Uncharacterized protein n=1 Tax=termite gut metagenome TaxID=433724 RepID=A0A5J4SCG7_9ZZZZ
MAQKKTFDPDIPYGKSNHFRLNNGYSSDDQS